MGEVTIIGVDLAKSTFQLHGADSGGAVVFRKKLSRAQVLPFLKRQPRCTVAMEACSTAHHWGRQIERLGHSVRLIAPHYVKPFVKRQKNDAADAEAIVEAALRPTMRFVALKSGETQARSVLFRSRDLLIRQRSQLINALRSHLAEYGRVVPRGKEYIRHLAEDLENSEIELPEIVRTTSRLLLDQIASLTGKIVELERTIRTESAAGPNSARLQTMPGIGPITAMAIETFAPPMETFRRGRDFAAWLGLVPRQNSTGGKQILGKTSKMGQRDVRRLLISGAMALLRSAVRKPPPEGSWLARMLERKPRMLVAIALANKMARSVWAMLVKQENFRNSAAAA